MTMKRPLNERIADQLRKHGHTEAAESLAASSGSASFEYPCTECRGDAYIGMSNWSETATGKIIIGKDERLCNRCAKKRNIEWSFHAKKS